MTEERYQVTGTVYRVGDMQTVGQNGFTKRELVLETGDKYKQFIALECHKDKCSLLDGMNVGDTVTAHFNLNGRLWNDKVFNKLVCWRVQLESDAQEELNYERPAKNPIPESHTLQDEDVPF